MGLGRVAVAAARMERVSGGLPSVPELELAGGTAGPTRSVGVIEPLVPPLKERRRDVGEFRLVVNVQYADRRSL